MTELMTSDHVDPANRFGAASPGVVAPVAVSPGPPPSESRRRRPWLWPVVAAAAVLLAGGGYLGGRLSAPRPGPLVVDLSQGVAGGAPVTASDLRLVHVTHAPAGAVTSISAAMGSTAVRDLPVGAVLTTSDIGPAAAYPSTGKVLVGVSVKPGQEPAEGLQPGDNVFAVEQPQSQNGKPTAPVVIVVNAQVAAVSDTSGGESVTLVVPLASSVTLAAQASAGNVALVKTAKP